SRSVNVRASEHDLSVHPGESGLGGHCEQEQRNGDRNGQPYRRLNPRSQSLSTHVPPLVDTGNPTAITASREGALVGFARRDRDSRSASFDASIKSGQGTQPYDAAATGPVGHGAKAEIDGR